MTYSHHPITIILGHYPDSVLRTFDVICINMYFYKSHYMQKISMDQNVTGNLNTGLHVFGSRHSRNERHPEYIIANCKCHMQRVSGNAYWRLNHCLDIGARVTWARIVVKIDTRWLGAKSSSPVYIEKRMWYALAYLLNWLKGLWEYAYVYCIYVTR